MNTQRDPRTYAIIGAAMEVHKQLGHGFLEAVYQEALAVEMELREIPFSREVVLPVHYKNRKLAVGYRADFLCFENVVVELKALRKLSTNEEAQILNYLKATGFETGLLINFGSRSLEYKRYARTNDTLVQRKNNLRNLRQSADKNINEIVTIQVRDLWYK